MIDFNLAIQTLITKSNKESSKLRKLNVLRYYNASGTGIQIYEWGRRAINPNYLLQTFDSYIIVLIRKINKCAEIERGKMQKTLKNLSIQEKYFVVSLFIKYLKCEIKN